MFVHALLNISVNWVKIPFDFKNVIAMFVYLPTVIIPFQPSVAFHRETSQLFCCWKEMAGFYMKCNTGLKWVKREFLKW